jgi:hypothetical protein
MALMMGFESAMGTIALGTSLSGAINLGAARVRGILMPSAWTTAALSFLVSIDGVNFAELIDARVNGYSFGAGYPVAASQYLLIDPVIFDGIPIIKVRSGTAASPVNQAASALITLIQREY